MSHTQYKGRITQSGNSKSLRLEAGFFKADSSFSMGSDIVAEYLGEGVAIVKSIKPDRSHDSIDPVMTAFLAFLEKDMAENPQSIQPLTSKELDELDDLVQGVELD